MGITNKVSFTISDEELARVNGALDTLSEVLEPKVLSLTPESRQELPKMGDKTLSFVEKAIELGNQNPDFVPPFADLPETNIDLNGFRTLRVINRRLEALSQKLGDTGIQSGSEAYTVALGIYNQIKAVAKAVGSAESQQAEEELRARFPGTRVKPKDPEPVSA